MGLLGTHETLQARIFVPTGKLDETRLGLTAAGFNPEVHERPATLRTTSEETSGRFVDVTLPGGSEEGFAGVVGEFGLAKWNQKIILEPKPETTLPKV